MHKKEAILHITKAHTGKMKGMQSMSTCCRTNKNCAEHAKIKGSICEKCYAQRMMKMYQNLAPVLERNGEILSSRILKEDELPLINAAYFRFEAFGDLINETHALNYFNIAKRNPDVHFALWTKNPQFIKGIADQKPKNLRIILSSMMLNKPADASSLPFIDSVFTVYDKKTIEQDKININCGARSCLTCHRCYTGHDKIINEKVK